MNNYDNMLYDIYSMIFRFAKIMQNTIKSMGIMSNSQSVV